QYTPAMSASYRDFGTWHGAEWLRRGVGLYFDNSMPKRSFSTVTTSAYEREDGVIVPSCGIWNHRAYLKRIWVLHKQLFNPRTPQIMMIHMTNTQVLPYHGWNQVNLDLEWMRKRPNEAMFQAKFGHDLLRVQSTGLQTGNIPTAMTSRPRAPQHVPQEWLDEHGHRYNQIARLALLVHEVNPSIGGRPYPEPLDEFGYGLPDCRVVNYWSDDSPLSVSDEQCKWLLLQRDEALMIVLCTWNPEASEVTLRLDAEALDVSLGEAVDANSGEVLPMEDHRVTVSMEGHGARIIRLE
ncbi:MAG: glycoside hydrolase domain-containing protein, partial [Phycisphaeraceae bacterium]